MNGHLVRTYTPLNKKRSISVNICTIRIIGQYITLPSEAAVIPRSAFQLGRNITKIDIDIDFIAFICYKIVESWAV